MREHNPHGTSIQPTLSQGRRESPVRSHPYHEAAFSEKTRPEPVQEEKTAI